MQESAEDYFLSNKARFRQSEDEEDAADLFFAIKNMHRHGAEVEWDDTLLKMGEVLKQTKAELEHLIEVLEEEGEPEEVTEVSPGLAFVDSVGDKVRRLISRFRIRQKATPEARGIVGIDPLITEYGKKEGEEGKRLKIHRLAGSAEISSRRSGDTPTTATADLERHLHDEWKPWTPWATWDEFDESVYISLAGFGELAMEELVVRAMDPSHPDYNLHPMTNKDMTNKGGLFPYLWWMIARDGWDENSVSKNGTGVDLNPSQILHWNSESPAMLPSTYLFHEGIMDYDGSHSIRKVESGLRDVDHKLMDRVFALGARAIKDTHLHWMRVRNDKDIPYGAISSGTDMARQMTMSSMYEDAFNRWKETNRDKMSKNISKPNERLLFKNWFQLAFDLGHCSPNVNSETNDWIFQQIVGPGKKPASNYSWNGVRKTREFQDKRTTGNSMVGMPIFQFGLQFLPPGEQMYALALWGMYMKKDSGLEVKLSSKDPAENRFRVDKGLGVFTIADLLDHMTKFNTIWNAHIHNNLTGGPHTGQASIAPTFQGDTDMLQSIFRDSLRNAHGMDFSLGEWRALKENRESGAGGKTIRSLKGVDRIARSKKKELESYTRMLRGNDDLEWNEDKGLPQSWVDDTGDIYDISDVLYDTVPLENAGHKIWKSLLSLVSLLPDEEQNSAYHRMRHWLLTDPQGLMRCQSTVALANASPYTNLLMPIIEGEYDVPRHDDVGAHKLSPTAIFTECQPQTGANLSGPDCSEWTNLLHPPYVEEQMEDELILFDYANAVPPKHLWGDCPSCEDNPGYVKNSVTGEDMRCKRCKGNPKGCVRSHQYVDWLRSIGSADERGGFSPIALEVDALLTGDESLEQLPIMGRVIKEHIPTAQLMKLTSHDIVQIGLRARTGRLARKKMMDGPVSDADTRGSGFIRPWSAAESGSGPDVGEPGERPESEGALGESPEGESVWDDEVGYDDDLSSLTELRARTVPSLRWVWGNNKRHREDCTSLTRIDGISCDCPSEMKLDRKIIHAAPALGKKPTSVRGYNFLGMNFPGMDNQFLFGPEEASVDPPADEIVRKIGEAYDEWFMKEGKTGSYNPESPPQEAKDDTLSRVFLDTEIVDRKADKSKRDSRKITLHRGHNRNIRTGRNVRTFNAGMYHKQSRLASRWSSDVATNDEGDYMDDPESYTVGRRVRGGGHVGITNKRGVPFNKDESAEHSLLLESGMNGFGKEEPWTFEDAEGNRKMLIDDPHGWARMHLDDPSQWLGGLKHPFGFGESVRGHLGLYDDEDWLAHPELEYAGSETGKEPSGPIYLYKLDNDGALKMLSWKDSSSDYRARDDNGNLIDENHPDYDEDIRTDSAGMVSKVPDLRSAMPCDKNDSRWQGVKGKYFFTFIPEGTVNIFGEPGDTQSANIPLVTAGPMSSSIEQQGGPKKDKTHEDDVSRNPKFHVHENFIITDPETGDKFAVGPHPSNIYAQYAGLLQGIDRMEGGFRNNSLRRSVMRRAHRLAPKVEGASQAKHKSAIKKRNLYTFARHFSETKRAAECVIPFLIAHAASELYTPPKDYIPSEHPMMAKHALDDYVDKYLKPVEGDSAATIESKSAMCRRLFQVAHEWGAIAKHDEDEDGDKHGGFKFSEESSARKKMLESLLRKGFQFSDWQVSNFLAPDWNTDTRFNTVTYQPPIDIEPGSLFDEIMYDDKSRDIEGFNLLSWAARELYADDSEHDIDARKTLNKLLSGFSTHFSKHGKVDKFGLPEREVVLPHERTSQKNDLDAIKEARHHEKGKQPLHWMRPSKLTPSGQPKKYSDTTEERVRRGKRAKYSLGLQDELKKLVLSVGSMGLTERHKFFRFLTALEPVMEHLESNFKQYPGFLLDHTFHRELEERDWGLNEDGVTKKRMRLIEEYARLLFLRGRTAEDYRSPPKGTRDSIGGRPGSSMWYGSGFPEEGKIDLDRGATPSAGMLHHSYLSTAHFLPHDFAIGKGSTISTHSADKLPGIIHYPVSPTSLSEDGGPGMQGDDERHMLGQRVVPVFHKTILDSAISLPGADEPGVNWVPPTNSTDTGAMASYAGDQGLRPKMDGMSTLPLDALTDTDLLLKEEDRDKGKPIPVKAMHRIFDLSDLEHLRGFSDDWVVTSWPDGQRVLVNKEGEKRKVYDSEGKSVSLPNKIKKDLLDIHDKDYLVDGIWDGEILHIVDVLECGGNDLSNKATRDRSRHLRSEFEATENVRTPAPVNTKRVDGEGLERATKDLLSEKGVKQILLRDADSTYMRGESRHPKWVMLTPEQQIDVRIVSSNGDNHLMGVGPIYENDAKALGNRSVTFDGHPYMDVGTIQRDGLEEGQYITVGVSGVSESTRNKYSLFRLISPRYKKESEGGATDSVETLDILNRRAGGNIPHRVRIKKGRIYIEVPTGDVVYETEPHGNAFVLKDVDAPDDYTLRVVESQIDYWSPLAAILLRSEKESSKKKEKIQEEPPANHDKKPKKVDENQLLKEPEMVKSVVIALEMIDSMLKEKITWTGPKGLGIDYATPVESPSGPTDITEPYDMPDHDPAHRQGEDGDCWCGSRKGEECKQGTGHKMKNCPEAHPRHKKKKAAHLKVSQDSQNDSSV